MFLKKFVRLFLYAFLLLKSMGVSVLIQPCRSCSLLVTLKASYSVSINEINDDDNGDNDNDSTVIATLSCSREP